MPVTDVVMAVHRKFYIACLEQSTFVVDDPKYFAWSPFFPTLVISFGVLYILMKLRAVHSVALVLFRRENFTRRPYCILGNGIRSYQDEVASGMVMFVHFMKTVH